jgi:hypothetical protein
MNISVSDRQQATCFIGSSAEGLAYARALGYHLRRAGVDVQEWDLSTFAMGKTTIEALEQSLSQCSFAALVASADDKTISRHQAKLSPRDNIIFELGLFAGRIGRDRTFLLVPADGPTLKLPSDLLGITFGSYRTADTVKKRREGMVDVADEIVELIERLGPIEAPSDPALSNELLGSVSRQLVDLARRSNLELSETSRDAWVQAVLTAVVDPFLVRSDDAYAVWLRPGADKRLDVAASSNLSAGYSHYRWGRAEGLVGRVWDTGTKAAVSAMKTHPWYEAKPGCANESYVCAAVGQPAGPGGVLAVGSDAGFPIYQGDEGLVGAYAAMLSLLASEPA